MIFFVFYWNAWEESVRKCGLVKADAEQISTSNESEDLSPASKKYKTLENKVLVCITKISNRGLNEQRAEVFKVASHILTRIYALESKLNAVDAVLAKQESYISTGIGLGSALDPEMKKIVKDFSEMVKKDQLEKAGKKPLSTEVADELNNLSMIFPSNLQVAAQAALQKTDKAMEDVPLQFFSVLWQ